MLKRGNCAPISSQEPVLGTIRDLSERKATRIKKEQWERSRLMDLLGMGQVEGNPAVIGGYYVRRYTG
jgi:hypothetical protein